MAERPRADGPPTRGEFVMLMGMVRDLARDTREWRKDHERLHDEERRSLVSSRRWIVGTLIAALAVIEPPILYLAFRR